VNFIQKVKDVLLEEEEILVSFDIVSLFPSIPIVLSLEYMEDWFVQRPTVESNKVKKMHGRQLFHVSRPRQTEGA
jgi:hypothetical protein